jgi:hypothetical protein
LDLSGGLSLRPTTVKVHWPLLSLLEKITILQQVIMSENILGYIAVDEDGQPYRPTLAIPVYTRDVNE